MVFSFIPFFLFSSQFFFILRVWYSVIQLAEERVTVDDLQRQLANSKRKVKSLNAELEDMKHILEAAQGHNIELEKKQRKLVVRVLFGRS